MSISLEIGLSAIGSYKRLAYTPWHAIAEFVDKSTQSYYKNKVELDKNFGHQSRALRVKIEYEPDKGFFRIEDNAMGMTYEELQSALIVAKPPQNSDGRSKYGMGLKTAACWIGNTWSVKTKKLGETIEHTIEIDVEKIASGNNILPYSSVENLNPDTHYTIVEIKNLNRYFKGRTLGKIGQYLMSMYREDFRNNILTLIWRDEALDWPSIADKLLTDKEGNQYFKKFVFEITGENGIKKSAHGWVGVLGKGSRAQAGFSILHSGRMVRGWPDSSWRPTTLYGQEEGSNDLVNQRLLGEIHLDDFDVSHTKDDILWLGDELDQVEDALKNACWELREIALGYRKYQDDTRGPTELESQVAFNELQEELNSKEFIDLVTEQPLLPKILVDEVVRGVRDSVVNKYTEKFRATLDVLTVKGYVEWDMSPNDPYVTIDSTSPNEVIVIVNAAHPHWIQLKGAPGVLNYLRHCAYDGISEWKARNKVQRLDPETIKLIKDKLLRLPMDIERHSTYSE